jgi:hypothetical protein
MEKTWKPMVAGILDLVAGVLGFIAGLLVITGMAFFAVFSTTGGMSGLQEYPPWLPMVVLFLIIPSIILNILAVIGGIYALRRRIWGLALAGSIAAIFSSFFLGIPSIIFTIQAKNEFE